MGVNYYQHCIFGVMWKDEELVVETQAEEFHMEDRFDEKTGNKTGEVRVVDIPRRETYEILGIQDESMYELLEVVTYDEKYRDLDFAYDGDEQEAYIGFSVGDNYDMGRIEMLVGDTTISKLEQYEKRIEELWPGVAPRLYFIATAG